MYNKIFPAAVHHRQIPGLNRMGRVRLIVLLKAALLKEHEQRHN
jgi:hypothetical protein